MKGDALGAIGGEEQALCAIGSTSDRYTMITGVAATVKAPPQGDFIRSPVRRGTWRPLTGTYKTAFLTGVQTAISKTL